MAKRARVRLRADFDEIANAATHGALEHGVEYDAELEPNNQVRVYLPMGPHDRGQRKVSVFGREAFEIIESPPPARPRVG